jgi:hypothetical protein
LTKIATQKKLPIEAMTALEKKVASVDLYPKSEQKKKTTTTRSNGVNTVPGAA